MNVDPVKDRIKRSRNGCHACKKIKVKCDEQKPSCSYCLKRQINCDYTRLLTWGGRPYKNTEKRMKASISGENKFAVQMHNPTESTRGTKKRKVVDSPVSSVSSDSSKFVFEESNVKKSKKILQKQPESQPFTNILALSSTPIQRSVSSLTKMSLDESRSTTPSIVSYNSQQEESLLNNLAAEGEKDKSDKISLLDQIPQISDGIESLSHALENIASGGNLFNIKNSEIFNNFVLSNIEDKRVGNIVDDMHFISQVDADIKKGLKNPSNTSISETLNQLHHNTSINPSSTPTTGLGSFAIGWEHDDVKFEQLFPNKPSSYIDEVLSPASVLSSFSRRHPPSNYNIKDLPLPGAGPGNSASTSSMLPLIKQLLDPLNAFDSVPPPLTPLPELLLQVPYYRELFHFWINVASDHLVPAPSTMYHENPFKVILPRMAMDSPSILTTLLAFAATVSSQYSFSLHESRGIIDQLLSRSCTELLKLLQDKKQATSDKTLATVLLLSCLEVFGCGNFDRHRAHTLGARQIILSRGLKLPTNQKLKEIKVEDQNLEGDFDSQLDSVDKVFTPTLVATTMTSAFDDFSETSESDVTFFLMRWFAYVDVIGALSATKKSDNYLCHKKEDDFYHDTKNLQIEKSGHIDRLLGFDMVLLPLFADIALLIRQTNAYLATKGARQDALPIAVITKSLEIQENMKNSFASGELKRKIRLEKAIAWKRKEVENLNGPNCSPTADVQKIIDKDNVLRSTNKIFFNMALLNLYRRVLKTERKSVLIQDLCEEIGDILQLNIEPKSPAEICSIFCTFCAACESTDSKMQRLFHARFTLLAEMGLTSATRSLQIMERCWATGEDWMHAAMVLNIDITLL